MSRRRRALSAAPVGWGLALLLVAGLGAAGPTPAAPPSLPSMVAHGGGAVDGEPYWNSEEALTRSHAAGFRAIELDLSWTADGRLVALHDWEQTFHRLYGPWRPPLANRIAAWLDGGTPRPALHQFLRLGRPGGPTPLSLAGVAAWLRAHPGVVLITDVKGDNLPALRRIRARYPDLVPRIVPQAYRFGQVARLRALGYPRVILTLYRLDADDDAVVAFARRERPDAVTVPAERPGLARLAARLQSAGIFVYAHTLNDPAAARRLLAAGVDGLYTDTLPPDFAASAREPRDAGR